jgi:hypothetical protein
VTGDWSYSTGGTGMATAEKRSERSPGSSEPPPPAESPRLELIYVAITLASIVVVVLFVLMLVWSNA